jgi:hypothetical protein
MVTDNVLILRSDAAKGKEVAQIEKVDETAKNLGTKAALADKYSALIYGMPTYEGFEDILLTIPKDLRSTADYWTQTTKPALMASVTKLRSFCSTYTSYFPDLVKELEVSNTSIAAQKENLIDFLGEILPLAKTSIEHIKESNRLSQLFLREVEENKYNLNSKVIPNIQERISKEEAAFRANQEAIRSLEIDIAFAEQQFVKAMGGTIASGVGLGISATLYVFRKQVNSLVSKVTPKFITNLGSKISAKIGGTAFGRIAGKAMPIIGGVFILVEIGGLIAGAIYWDKYKRERDRLQKRKNELVKKGLDLSADLIYLDDMASNFSKLLIQSNEVADAFNQLNTAWHSVYLSMDELNSKLKDMDAKKEKINFLFKGKIRDVNSAFTTLEDKLRSYELNFVLGIDVASEVGVVDADSASEMTMFSAHGNVFMPNKLFSAYTKTY